MENKHKEFKPFDKVLVGGFDEKWSPTFYKYFDEGLNLHVTMEGCLDDEYIIPYEGNVHLVGTTEEPEEEIELEKGEYILASDFINPLAMGFGEIGKFIEIEGGGFTKTVYNNGLKFNYIFAIRLSDSINSNDMKDRKSKILCVKNGKVVRYKK